MAASSSSLVDQQNPWPGLSSYTENAQAFFFGRVNEIREILSRIEARPLTLLFGQSGLGKTSLLQAGVMPRLRKKNYLPVLVRLDYDPSAPEFDAQITAALLAALNEIGASAPSRLPGTTENESLWEWLHRSDTRLVDSSGRTLAPILIIDQFEEIFTLGERDAVTRARSQRWFRSLAYLVENWCPADVKRRMEEHEDLLEELDLALHPIRVLIGMREDYLPHLDEREDEMPSMMLNRLRLTPLRGTQALEAVHDPAPGLVTRQVAETIVRFVAGQAQTDLQDVTVAPPILNLVCRELNKRRMARGLTVITPDLIEGDAGKILRQFYEESLAGHPNAVRIFIEDELLSDSCHRENISEERAEREMARKGVPKTALDDLVSRRLLQKEERMGRLRIELIHDVLCVPIAASRAERYAREKDEKDQAEKLAALEKIQKMRSRIAQFVGALIVAVGLLIYAIVEAVHAREATEKIKQGNDRLAAIVSTMEDSQSAISKIGESHPEFIAGEILVFRTELQGLDKVDTADDNGLMLKFQTAKSLALILPNDDKNNDEKLKIARETVDLAEMILKVDQTPDHRALVAMGLGTMMRTFYQLHQKGLAQQTYQRATEVINQSGLSPGPLHYRKSLLLDWYVKAADLSVEEKGNVLQQDLMEAQAADTAQPEEIAYVDQLAAVLIRRADYLYEKKPGDPEIDQDLQNTFELVKKIVNDLCKTLTDPTDIISYRGDAAYFLHMIAWIEWNENEYDKAEENFANYVKATAAQVAANPELMGVEYNYEAQQNLLALAWRDRGNFERARAKEDKDENKRGLAWDQAEDSYQESIAAAKSLVDKHGNVAEYRKTLGQTYHQWQKLEFDHAQDAIKSGDLSDATTYYQKGSSILESYLDVTRKALEMVASREELKSYQDDLVDALGVASYARLFVGRYDDAQQAAEEAIAKDPSQNWVYTNLAHALLLRGEYDKAWVIYSKHVSEKMYSDDPETFVTGVLSDFDDFEKAKGIFTEKQLADIKRMRLQLQPLAPAPAPQPAAPTAKP